eukprot:jgi/Tetstr1/430748/TSEL_020533.t1
MERLVAAAVNGRSLLAGQGVARAAAVAAVGTLLPPLERLLCVGRQERALSQLKAPQPPTAGAQAAAFSVRSCTPNSSLQAHSNPRSARPTSLLLSFLLGSGCGAAGTAVYTSSALNSVPEEGCSAGSRGPSGWGGPQSTAWWDHTRLQEAVGGLLGAAAAAASVGTAKRSRVAQLESATDTAAGALGRHFIADAAAKAFPAVVNITVNHNVAPPSRSFGVYGGKSSGSGFIIDAGGVILTNAHVILDSSGRQPATGITVTLQDGRILEGEVASFDRVSDIAVLQVRSREPLPVVKLGSSMGLRVGEWVVSLGSPLHLQNSVTHGIISCVDRKAVDLGLAGACPEYIQTDAPINQGSSGGPLVNLDGEVIGMTAMKALAADGVSFAIPIDTAKQIVEQLSDKGRVVRPYLGIKMLALNPQIAEQLRQRDPRFPNVQEGIVVRREQRGPSRPGNMCTELISALSQHVGSALELTVLRSAAPGSTATHRIKVKASEAVSRD